MTSGIPITHVDPQAVIASYQSGKTMREVGEEFGVSLAWVYNTLRKNKIKSRSRGGAESPGLNERIIELRRAGLSMTQIAFIVDRCRTNVRDRLTRAGVMK
jgi:hypothetical protein